MSAEVPPPDHDATGLTSRRIERKYTLDEGLLDELVPALGGFLPIYRYPTAGAGASGNGRHAWSSIRTIYLDTPDLRCYQEYLQDLPLRRKIRIRQYGLDGRFEDACWVEIKVKDRRISLKRRFKCRLEDLDPFMRGQDILSRIREHNCLDLPGTYRTIQTTVREQHLSPVVRVDYERLSFQQPEDPSVRLTLDRRVVFRCTSRHHHGVLEGLVLEVKRRGPKPAWLAALRQQLDLPGSTRFSKFANSLKRLHKLRDEDLG